jgi:uncharacterized caspase-like protein
MSNSKPLIAVLLITIALLTCAVTVPAQTDRGPTLVTPTSGEIAGHDFYTNSYVLIIGINQYPKLKDSDLHFAVRGAKDLRDMLIKSYGFPAENVTLLLDGGATKKEIEDALGDLADGTRVKETDRVLVFFAGHGQTVKLADGGVVGFLLPSDANADLAHPENRSGYLTPASI